MIASEEVHCSRSFTSDRLPKSPHKKKRINEIKRKIDDLSIYEINCLP